MELIYKSEKEKEVSKPQSISFTIDKLGICLIEISARAKSEKQLKGSDDEDLRIEIDKRKFPQLTNSKRYFDSPASFSGGTQKGLKKTVYFLHVLEKGKHTIALIPDMSATILNISVSKVTDNANVSNLGLNINNQAEDGDRRSWITFVLVDLALEEFIIELNLKRRFLDSDDIKVVVDGNIKRNTHNFFRRFWYFIASLFAGEVQTEIFNENLPRGLHYIEFWADRMPILKSIKFSGLSSDTEETIQEKIERKAKEFGLDPNLILRVVERESAFDPNAVSPVGAKGLFQLMDITIEQISKLGFEVTNPFDVDQNIQGGLIYFKWLFERYSNDAEQLEKTLAAWNWGLSNIPLDEPLDYETMPKETREFIRFVVAK